MIGYTQQNKRVEEVTMTSIPAITEQAIRSFAGEQNFHSSIFTMGPLWER